MFWSTADSSISLRFTLVPMSVRSHPGYAGDPVECRIEDVALAHSYAQVSMIIRCRQSRRKDLVKRLNESEGGQIAEYLLTCWPVP
jgi:hypothetical protein